MDYHSERFTDHSLLIYDKASKLVALLPANISNGILYSHQGLTFGGLVYKSTVKQVTVLGIFGSVIDYLKKMKIEKLVYKAMPWIYHQVPAEEDLYALFRYGAKFVKREVSSSIKLDNRVGYSKGRNWLLKKARKESIEVAEITELSSFWEMLETTVMSAHGIIPVHSLADMTYLAESFPNNIRIFTVIQSGKTLAGTVLFISPCVVHTQYMFNTAEGREIGALDFLIDSMINREFDSCTYFDFGISTEDQGAYLNEGLIAQKEGFGARAVCHDVYEIEL